MKSQKGITLIALVITIIVMLILVAVTITMAVNGGLFNYAQKASNDTNSAKVDEQHLGDGLINVQTASGVEDYGSINSIVDHYTKDTAITTQH